MTLIKQKKRQLVLDGHTLSTNNIVNAAENIHIKVIIKPQSIKKIRESHNLLNKFVKEGRIIYGVNTSLGGFVNWLVPLENARELQENLISAVATNVGPYLEDTVVRASMLARLNSLARGCSAISLENFNKLLQMYNAGIIPCVPSKGSLGASGDLGPLAAIALVATGKWKAKFKGKIISGEKALNAAKIEPMKLSYKEGLSLINGTSAMAGLAAILVEKAITSIKSYDIISCLSFETLKIKKKAFDPIVHFQKPHTGQLQTAKNFWALLNDSQMIVDEDQVSNHLKKFTKNTPQLADMPIEDAYSIRCSPHILGPIRDSIKWIQSIITNELNSSNDNPLVICESHDVFHNGHFHGQYISMAMDYLAICLTTLSNLSDRRIDRFMDQNNSNKLPAFLCAEKPGLRLGLMGGQFMATSLTAENRSLCNPVSIQSLPSTGDFQDIVSLGLVAARKTKEIYENMNYVIAFELLCAAQAAELRGIHLLSKSGKCSLESVRNLVPYLSSDQCLTDHLERLAEHIKTGKFLNHIEKRIGKIAL
ncbi:MAG: phenylalanine aminomutase (D-beta-phenylalanine forming) [Chlamydiia bacterium]|nr:phenylalanine aminomutase (D-beta-phenylalanine forming) [Chlamydiia bacterium]